MIDSIESGSIYNARVYSSVSEMNSKIASDSVVENDIAAVYNHRDEIIDADYVQGGQTYDSISFPQEVVLPEAPTMGYTVWIIGSSNTFRIDFSSSSFIFQWMQTGFRVEYTSEDELTYTTSGEQTCTGSITIPPETDWATQPWDSYKFCSLMVWFMIHIDYVPEINDFLGIYKYDGTQYNLVTTQFDAAAGDILSGKKAYTNTGVTTGSLVIPDITINIHDTGMKCSNSVYADIPDDIFDISTITADDLSRGIFSDCTLVTEFSSSVISRITNCLMNSSVS